MHRRFDHENLKVYQMGITFCGWCTPLMEGIASRVAARDQLDRASTSNIAEGNGKRSYRDRSRFFDIARGSGVESAACLDVLVARGLVETEVAEKGKAQLFETVSMIGGLLARFAGDGRVEEDQAECGIDKEKEKE